MNEDRVKELSDYVEYWENALNEVVNIRTRLLQDKELGFVLLDDNKNDVLQERINMVDASVIQHQEILTKMTSLRDRARSGEDV